MLNIQNNVKEIRLYKNGILFNGDITSGADITQCDYLHIINKGELVKTIFKSNLLY